MHVTHRYTRVHVYVIACMWRAGNNSKELNLSAIWGYQGQVQALRLGSKHLLGHRPSLHTFQTWVEWQREGGVSGVVVKEGIGCWG